MNHPNPKRFDFGKIAASSGFVALISVMAFLASCTSGAKDELKGEWIWELQNEKVEQGYTSTTYYTYRQFDFESDVVHITDVMEVDDDVAYKISVDAEWDYITGDFEDSNVIGVLEIDYDMDSFAIERINKEYKSYVEELREDMVRHNTRLERVRSKSRGDDTASEAGVMDKVKSMIGGDDDTKRNLKDYYGYNVLRISGKRIVFAEGDGQVEWERPSSYDKGNPTVVKERKTIAPDQRMYMEEEADSLMAVAEFAEVAVAEEPIAYIAIVDEDKIPSITVNQGGQDDVDKFEAVHEQVVVREPEPKKATDDEVFVAVEQQAEFPGGQAALMKWLSNNIRYPEAAQQNEIQGRVVVKFIVEKDGSISHAEIVRGVDQDLDREALRVVQRMPKWQPGKNGGVAVRSYFNLPVTFKLQTQ